MFHRVLLFLVVITGPQARAAEHAADATNAFGLDLLRASAPAGNVIFSPFSISAALTMTMGGAAGLTQEEMAKVLHVEKRADKASEDFAALRKELMAMITTSAKDAAAERAAGRRADPVQFRIANRLFGQSGYGFLPEFIEDTKIQWQAPLQALDFRQSEAARQSINGWAKERTAGSIMDLLPPGNPSVNTKLVLANAIWFKAPWRSEFEPAVTLPVPFNNHGGKTVNVSTMYQRSIFGHTRGNGFTAVTLGYRGADVHMLILLPEARDGLDHLVKSLTAAQLAKFAKLDGMDIKLWLPKFKLTPPTMNLTRGLQQLGMKSAFDAPAGSADFSNIASRTSNDYLALTDIFHRTFISVDERGTEAAAATTASAAPFGAPPEKPVEVRVDRSFVFAIQHQGSGVCLFLGKVTELK